MQHRTAPSRRARGWPAAIGGASGSIYQDFANALTVLTTVVSKPTDDTAIVDGGLKAFSTDKPFVPESRRRGGIEYAWAGDEHGPLTLSGDARVHAL